jgi:hypothetical protein
LGGVAIQVTTPTPREAWLEVVQAGEHALAFHTPAWLDVLTAFGGYADSSRLYETTSGGRAVLPMVRRAPTRGRFAIEESLPFGWGFGGLVSAERFSSDEMRAVWEDIRRLQGLRRSVRQNPLAELPIIDERSAGLVVVPRLAHILDLAGGFDEVWDRRFRGTARTAVRKAEKLGLEIESGSAETLVSAFYGLYEKSIDRWTAQEGLGGIARWKRRRREPRRKFDLVAAHLQDSCRIFVAHHRGQPAAAIIVLFQGCNASYWRGAMDKDLAGPTRANYLLHAVAIEEACGAGCRFYHMGETAGSASLSQFKTRFGATGYEYSEYRLERLPLTGVARLVKPLLGWGLSR